MSAKLKLIERKLGLVPKQYPPMSPGMERIARQQERQAPAPSPEGAGLGETIESAVQATVDRALAVERERHAAEIQQLMAQINQLQKQPQPVRKRRPFSYSSEVTRRDHRGRILWTDSTDDETGEVLRTEVTLRHEDGTIKKLRTYDLDKPESPDYRVGPGYKVSQKPYGNDDPHEYREPKPR